MMSRTEGVLILDSQNAATTTGEKNPQGAVRRKLADISNLPQNIIRVNKSKSIETTTKEYIDQLQKENLALVKMLAQRNKIIEQTGTELDILRVNLHKMHEQNQQLALSNCQMFTELNSAKDRLKVLQHELGCKSGLLNARKLELEEKERTMACKNADTEMITSVEEVKVDEKTQKSKTSDCSEQVISKETTENNRNIVRRQSARFKAAELKPAEDLFETDDTKVHARLLPDYPAPEQGLTSESSLSKNEDIKSSSSLRCENYLFADLHA